jgi:outer membrane autotransporter protein
MYIDAAIGVARNHFDTRRHIPIAGSLEHHEHVVAKGSFDGTTWGAQADLGWFAVDNEDYFLVPIARLRWSHLDLDNVREKGAGDFGLHVRNDSSNEFLGGLGFRLGGKYETGNVQYIPELSAMVAYDFDHSHNKARSNFLGDPDGVFSFISENSVSNRTSFDVGLGVNAHMGKKSIFSIKYNLELRDQFVGNSGFVKYYYIWS